LLQAHGIVLKQVLLEEDWLPDYDMEEATMQVEMKLKTIAVI